MSKASDNPMSQYKGAGIWNPISLIGRIVKDKKKRYWLITGATKTEVYLEAYGYFTEEEFNKEFEILGTKTVIMNC